MSCSIGEDRLIYLCSDELSKYGTEHCAQMQPLWICVKLLAMLRSSLRWSGLPATGAWGLTYCSRRKNRCSVSVVGGGSGSVEHSDTPDMLVWDERELFFLTDASLTWSTTQKSSLNYHWIPCGSAPRAHESCRWINFVLSYFRSYYQCF